jgi:predicted transglutaminase-like cysteine proteinase
MALVIFFAQIVSSLAVAGERISIFGYVSLVVPRPAGIAKKFDNLGSPSAKSLAMMRDFMDSQNADTELEKLAAVNKWVNEKIEFTDDRGDEWKSANQTLASGKGDCEDHAIAKMQLLKQLGFESDQLYLMIVKDLTVRADHAILVVHSGDEYYVLDNMYDEVSVHSRFNGLFRPMLAMQGKQTWTFGILRTKDNQ